jgi:predicted MFS family arabinose efflux permease
MGRFAGDDGPEKRSGRLAAEPESKVGGVGWQDASARLLVPTLVTIGSLMAVVSSLGAPLIPTLSRADGVSLSTGEWILTITLLTGALVTPIMGRLADGPRQRDVILFTLGCVVVGCMVAAVSENFAELLIGRGLQGVGLGILPVTMAIARRHLSPEKARRTIATLSVTSAMGIGLGYPITGLIAQAWDFRAAYWFGAITVGCSLGFAAMLLAPRSNVPSHRLDILGAAMLSLVVVSLSVVLSEGGGWGWTSATTLGLGAATLVLLSGWIPYELRSGDPLVDLRQVRHRSVLTADVSGFFISIAMYMFLPTLVVFVQIPVARGYGLGASIVVSGLVLVPLSLCSFLASRLLTVYERRFGLRSMIPLGSLVFAGAAAFFGLEHRALWEAFVAAGLAGLGIGFTTGAMPGFLVRAVTRSETGSATGFYQVVRSIGLTLGSAVSAAVLTANTRPGQAIPDVAGFRDALLIAAGICAATAVISFVLPDATADRIRASSPAQQEELEETMEEEAELAGAGFVLAETRNPPILSSEDPQ